MFGAIQQFMTDPDYTAEGFLNAESLWDPGMDNPDP